MPVRVTLGGFPSAPKTLAPMSRAAQATSTYAIEKTSLFMGVLLSRITIGIARKKRMCRTGQAEGMTSGRGARRAPDL